MTPQPPSSRRPPASKEYLTQWVASLRGLTDGGGVVTRQLVAQWCGTSHSTIKKIAAGYDRITERLQYDLSALLTGLNDGTIGVTRMGDQWVLAHQRPLSKSTAPARRATIEFGAGAPSVTWGQQGPNFGE